MKKTARFVYSYSRLELAAMFLGTWCLSLGGLVLVGWLLHIRALVQLPPANITVQANTALGFLLVGLIFFLQSAGSLKASILPSIAIALLGLLTSLEYVTGLDFGIDQLLASPFVSLNPEHPGRMAPNTALAYLFLGIAFFLRTRATSSRDIYRFMGSISASVVVALTGLAVFGYLTDLTAAYRWGRFTDMALGTALTLSLSSGVLLAFFLRDSYAATGALPKWSREVLFCLMAMVCASLWSALASWNGRPVSAPALTQIIVTLFIALSLLSVACLQVLLRYHEQKQAVLELYDNAPCAYLSTALDGTIVSVNSTALKWLGLTREGLINQTRFQDLLAPDSKKVLADNFNDLPRTGSIKDLELRLVRKDETTLCALLSASVSRDSSGVISSVRTTFIDMTERKYEEATRDLQSWVLENIAEGVALVRTNDGKFVFANARFEKMFGYEAGELIGKSVSAVTAPGERSPEETAHIINSKVRAKGFWVGEVENRKKDGTRFWSMASVSTMRHPNFGEVWAVLHADITEKKEREARELQERANLSNLSKLAALGEMAGGVAHEINNPLSIIKGYADQLGDRLEEGQFDETHVKRGLKRISITVDRIAAIIRGLRAFCRDGQQDAPASKDLQSIVRETAILFEEKVRNLGVNLQLELPENPVRVSCRSVQISQIIMNLISNSLHAVSDLSEKWMRVEVTSIGGTALLAVVDSGNGIPEALREKITQPFFTTKPLGSGLGLGLSISLGIAQAHGGSLKLDESSQYTKFVLSLPLELQEGDCPSIAA